MKNILLSLVLVLIFSFSTFADKCVGGDCVNGYGKFYVSEGTYYEGNFKNAIFHGKGILVIDGVEGKGNFRNGLKHGKFILKDINGIETELKFKDDVIQ